MWWEQELAIQRAQALGAFFTKPRLLKWQMKRRLMLVQFVKWSKPFPYAIVKFVQSSMFVGNIEFIWFNIGQTTLCIQLVPNTITSCPYKLKQIEQSLRLATMGLKCRFWNPLFHLSLDAYPLPEQIQASKIEASRKEYGSVLAICGPTCMWHKKRIRACLLEVLKFNKHCSTFVLFDKKFLILD
jgi:hypothetical protein